MAIGDFVKKVRRALPGHEDKASAAPGKVAGVVEGARTSAPDAATTAGAETREPRPSYPVGGTFAPPSRAARPGHAPGSGATGASGREATP